MPRTLVLQALQAAKKGVSAKMEAFIKAKGMAAAQNYTVNQLKTVGVDEAAILAKVGKDKLQDLNLEDLVMLAADYKAIENGDAHASELFELKEAKSAAATDLKGKLKAQIEATPKAEAPKAEAKTTDVIVEPGKQPFSYYTADQHGEYLTSVAGDEKSCNCGHQPDGSCVHVTAVEAYVKA